MELTDGDVAALLSAGSAAPSDQDPRLRLLTWATGAVEVRGGPHRLLPVTDPDARELRLACGAAVANVHLAVRTQGRRAHTTLLPDPTDPWFSARVRPGSESPARLWERDLAGGIHRRPTGRHPLRLSPAYRDDLIRAAEREGCWLIYVDDPVGRRRIRDATGGRQGPDPAVMAVVATFQDGPRAHLHAGGAMQQVLLTAAAREVGTSVVASALDPDLRAEVRSVLGGGLWPQVVLGLGGGDADSTAPSRLRAAGA